jgi:hypothetical protein
MDRLLVGDVGYGKTEVAVRAAFKAVQAGKQVVVLVPTTILAEQHGRTFRERLADYPVRIEVLSRFRSPKETTALVQRIAHGEVDIVIGTHRLLSPDVTFKDLGLLIVDEEHRFGVSHKERLKTLKLSVDVLTLTATPIPRTLHLLRRLARPCCSRPRQRIAAGPDLVEPWMMLLEEAGSSGCLLRPQPHGPRDHCRAGAGAGPVLRWRTGKCANRISKKSWGGSSAERSISSSRP